MRNAPPDDQTAGRSETAWLPYVVAFVTLACCIVLVGAYYRGPFIDDFSTVEFSDPSVPFVTAWRELWSTETNPPFFYMIARLGVQILGKSLFARRMINLIPLVVLLGWFAYAVRRHPEHRGFLFGFAVFAFGGKFFLVFFPFYRSYFWQYCAEIIFAGAGAIGYLDRRRTPDPFQIAMAPALLMLHQVTVIYAAVLMALFVAVDLRRGLWLRASTLFIVALLSTLPLALFSVEQLRQPDVVISRISYIEPSSAIIASYKILTFLPPALSHNWIAIFAAVSIVLFPVRQNAETRALLYIFAGAAIVATVAVLVINERVPIVVARYFTFLSVEVGCMLALALAPLMRCSRWLAVLVLVNSTLFLITFGVGQAHKKMWNQSAELIEKMVKQCPTTRVHVGSMPIDHAEQIGLTYLASVHHFELLPKALDAPGNCPVIYWTQHSGPNGDQLALFGGDVVQATNYRDHLDLSKDTMAHSRAIVFNDGVIIVADKAPNSQ